MIIKEMFKDTSGENAIAWAILVGILALLIISFIPEVRQTVLDIIETATS